MSCVCVLFPPETSPNKMYPHSHGHNVVWLWPQSKELRKQLGQSMQDSMFCAQVEKIVDSLNSLCLVCISSSKARLFYMLVLVILKSTERITHGQVCEHVVSRKHEQDANTCATIFTMSASECPRDRQNILVNLSSRTTTLPQTVDRSFKHCELDHDMLNGEHTSMQFKLNNHPMESVTRLSSRALS